MNKILFTLFVIFTILPFYCWSIGADDPEKSDAQSEMDAQKDMLAYVQTTTPYRFGTDLKAGDSAIYEKTEKNEGEETAVSKLEVITRVGDIATIKEEFEGNVIIYKVDLMQGKLLEMSGTDEDGYQLKPALLSKAECENRMKTISGEKQTITPPPNPIKIQYLTKSQPETISINRASVSCHVRCIDTSSFSNLNTKTKEGFEKLTAIYVSNDIPKLIPVKLVATYLSQTEALAGNEGLVKNYQIQITAYHK